MTSKELFEELSARYASPALWVERTVAKMEDAGITQGALAQRSGFDKTQVSRWLGKSRRTHPSMESMVLMDAALDELLEEAARG